MNDDIMARLKMDLSRVLDTRDAVSAPTPGPWIVDSEGRIVAPSSRHPELDHIASVQTAPHARGNIPIICSASLMFDALKAINRDAGRKHLDKKTLELIDEALAGAE